MVMAPGGNLGGSAGSLKPANLSVDPVTLGGPLTLAGSITDNGTLTNSTTGQSLLMGSGAPAVGLGINGDFYFRSDTPGTANQRIYVKSAGAWTGIA